LNSDGFSLAKERQKDVNIFIVISQVADTDASGADLRSIVPKDAAIIWIARRCRCIGTVKKQV
jgi:hypothetical protein